MTLPRISVITVSYNQGEFIKDNIESVLAQGYPNFEHIIVDGGSTDSTLEILKSYPHLKWTSAPDRGQSDALNQGFARASGEIIAWLNSDDWYAPNIFFDIAKALDEYPIVLGRAEETDRAGRPTDIVLNTPRSYYDLWRYWVPYAWLAQPSVFFRKSLLEEVKRRDGTYIDEDLYFTMDFDLWLRMAQRYPFTKHLDKTLSYFRIYDENKTGAHPLATQRECSRVFRRHAKQATDTEQSLSVIIPVDQPSDELKKTIMSLTSQSSLDFEIMLIDYAASKQDSKTVKLFSLDLTEVINHLTVRHVRAEHAHLFSALNTGIKKACAPLVTFLQPGDTVARDFCAITCNEFHRDVTGVIIHDAGLEKLFYPQSDTLNVAAPLTMTHTFPHWTMRRTAAIEVDLFADFSRYPLSPKKGLLDLIFRNWSISFVRPDLVTAAIKDYSRENSFLESNSMNITLSLLVGLQTEWNATPFSEIRSKVRDAGILFRALPANAAEIVAKLPADWASRW